MAKALCLTLLAIFLLYPTISAQTITGNGLDPASIDISAQNLIANGGFEQGFSDWQIGGCSACSGISTSTVYGGAQSYSVDTTAVTSSSFIWQNIPRDLRDFALRLVVNRSKSNNTVELVRGWDSISGNAELVSEVNFADPTTGTLRWRAWHTELITDFVWPSESWHELVIIANWSKAEQMLYVDGELIATLHASSAFSPEHLILGDVPGIGSHAQYFFDDVFLAKLPLVQQRLFLPVIIRN